LNSFENISPFASELILTHLSILSTVISWKVQNILGRGELLGLQPTENNGKSKGCYEML